jgi:pimeloyl-ACP methyl ester carboxylesterase
VGRFAPLGSDAVATTTVHARIDGTVDVRLSVGYEVLGERGRPFAITPGGRFGRDSPGVRELAVELAALGNRVLIWDRPNTGESDVCFVGSSESAMQGDVLAALLTQLGMVPAVITGGSGGARVSLLTAARQPGTAAGLGLWWITGGVYGMMRIGTTYGGESIPAAWRGGMEAVVELPEWAEVLEKNPSNREHFLAQDPAKFIETMERWMLVHCPCGDELVPGLPDAGARSLHVPTLLLHNGMSDPVHTRATSTRLGELLPDVLLTDPPWPDTEAMDSLPGRRFVGWPALAPVLHVWAERRL